MGNITVPDSVKQKFDEEEQKDLVEKFRKAASKNHINQSSFTSLYLSKYPLLSLRLFKVFLKGKGDPATIDFPRYAERMATIKKGSRQEQIQVIYEMFDIDNNGKVSKDELKTIFSSTLFDPIRPEGEDTTFLKALYDFEGSGENELKLKDGDILIFLQAKESWWWCQKEDKSGYVPANYVEIMENVDKKSLPSWITPPETAEEKMIEASGLKLDKDGNLSKDDFFKWAGNSNICNLILDQFNEIQVGISSFTLSRPKNFRHEAHFGVNPKTGNFEVENLPDSWKTLFKKAGITDEHMQDKETQQVVFGEFAKFLKKEDMKSKGVKVEEPPPPPPPPSGPTAGRPQKKAPKPPTTGGEAPPPPTTGGGGGDAPPPPGPPEKKTGEQPAKGGTSLADAIKQKGHSLKAVTPEEKKPAPPRSGLLDQIKSGKKLHHVDVNAIDKLNDEQLTGLAGILSKALDSRRAHLMQPVDNNPEEDDEDWDD